MQVTMSLEFSSGSSAEIYLSSAEPRKRRFEVEGERQTIVFDDTEPGGSLTIIDDSSGKGGAGQELPLPPGEPLAIECAHFIDCILSRKIPLTGPQHALEVTRILEAAATSMANCHL